MIVAVHTSSELCLGLFKLSLYCTALTNGPNLRNCECSLDTINIQLHCIQKTVWFSSVQSIIFWGHRKSKINGGLAVNAVQIVQPRSPLFPHLGAARERAAIKWGKLHLFQMSKTATPTLDSSEYKTQLNNPGCISTVTRENPLITPFWDNPFSCSVQIAYRGKIHCDRFVASFTWSK